MKSILLRKVDTLCQAFKAEGYNAKATIKSSNNLTHHKMVITITGLTDQDLEQIRQDYPEARITKE